MLTPARPDNRPPISSRDQSAKLRPLSTDDGLEAQPSRREHLQTGARRRSRRSGPGRYLIAASSRCSYQCREVERGRNGSPLSRPALPQDGARRLRCFRRRSFPRAIKKRLSAVKKLTSNIWSLSINRMREFPIHLYKIRLYRAVSTFGDYQLAASCTGELTEARSQGESALDLHRQPRPELSRDDGANV
jgi:hypothetical protein